MLKRMAEIYESSDEIVDCVNAAGAQIGLLVSMLLGPLNPVSPDLSQPRSLKCGYVTNGRDGRRILPLSMNQATAYSW
jgi:hypothetical protein